MARKGRSIPIQITVWNIAADAGQTGDGANLSLRWIKDGVSAAPTNAPVEVDAEGAPGIYKVLLTDAECDCFTGTLAGVSSTPNVKVIPFTVAFDDWTASQAGEDTPISGSSYASLSKLKSYMGISPSDTSKDTLLSDLLVTVSRAIDAECDRTFASESLVEYYDGYSDFKNGFLHLRKMPVTEITRIAVHPHRVLLLGYAGSAERATVAVTTTALKLLTVSAGVAATTSLTLGDYLTLDALAAAITAAGFTASIASGYGNWPSAYLKAPQGAYLVKEGTRSGHAYLLSYIDELSWHRVDYDNGTIWGYFPAGVQEAEVRYSAGYATIPDAVVTATCIAAKAAYDQAKNDSTLGSERIGDYAWTRRNPVTMSDPIFAEALPYLRPYKRVKAL